MYTIKTIKQVVETKELADFGEKLLKDLANYQKNTNLCPIHLSDLRKAIRIIQKRAYGKVFIYGRCGNDQKEILTLRISFIHRKGKIAMSISLGIQSWKNKDLQVTSHTRKKITAKRIDPDLLWMLGDALVLMIGSKRLNKLRKYIEYRKERKKLLLAAKWGIDVSELKEILKQERYKERVIDFINLEEPFILVGMSPQKRILYTPFGKYEVDTNTYYARQAFRDLVKINRIPYGKEAMKKIEALLIQASI